MAASMKSFLYKRHAILLTERPWIQLKELDSDHGLNDVQLQLWQALKVFCQDIGQAGSKIQG